MKIYELKQGDKFKSINPEVIGEGICIAHKIYKGELTDLAIVWEDHFECIDKWHFWWNKECELLSSDNDVSEYQKTFKLKSTEIT